MPETDNIFTEIVVELQDEIAGLRENRARPTAFMHQELSAAGFRKNLDKMPSEERQKLLQSLGKEETLKLLRGK